MSSLLPTDRMVKTAHSGGSWVACLTLSLMCACGGGGHQRATEASEARFYDDNAALIYSTQDACFKDALGGHDLTWLEEGPVFIESGKNLDRWTPTEIVNDETRYLDDVEREYDEGLPPSGLPPTTVRGTVMQHVAAAIVAAGGTVAASLSDAATVLAFEFVRDARVREVGKGHAKYLVTATLRDARGVFAIPKREIIVDVDRGDALVMNDCLLQRLWEPTPIENHWFEVFTRPEHFSVAVAMLRAFKGPLRPVVEPMGSVQATLHEGPPVTFTGLVTGGAAERAGVVVGDVLTHVRGVAVTDWSSTEAALDRGVPGERLAITVTRGGRPVALTVELAAARTLDECIAGDIAACESVGYRVLKGRRATPIPDVGVSLLMRACKAGGAFGCAWVVTCHFADARCGVTPDLEMAGEAANALCEMNDGWGCEQAGLVVEAAPDVTNNERVVASELIARGCAAGYGPACHRVALRAQDGIGMRPNPDISKKYRALACKFGVTDDCDSSGTASPPAVAATSKSTNPDATGTRIGEFETPRVEPMRLSGKRVAVLEFTAKAGVVDVEVLTFLADSVRGAALDTLGARGATIMTRESMAVILADMGGCSLEEGQCEVETGRNIGADILATGDYVKVGSTRFVTLKVFDVKSGALLASKRVSAPDDDGIATKIDDEANALFAAALASLERQGR